MSAERASAETVELVAENVGGIDRTRLTLEPPVSLLTGRNATNRTSLLRAIGAALGSDDVSLKSDAERGSVELTIGGETYTRTLTRRNGGVAIEGEGYLDEDGVTEAELFAFLFETNEARRAVVRKDDLRKVIMRPVDTEEIEAEIERRRSEREEIDREMETIDELAENLPSLEERRSTLEDRIEEKRGELSEVREKIEAADDIGASGNRPELENAVEDLHETRSELKEVQDELKTERESVEALRDERADIEGKLAEQTQVDQARIDEIDAEIDRLRDRVQSVDSTVKKLQKVVEFNEETLEDRTSILRELQDEEGNYRGSITDQLVDDDQRVLCWTCRSEVETSEIRETVEILRDLIEEKIEERDRLKSEIDDLESERRDLEGDRRQREQLDRRLERTRREIDRREERIETLERRRDDLQSTVESLEAEVEDLRDEDYGEVLELRKRANELEFEIERDRDELEEVEGEIADIEDRLDDRDDLAERRAEVESELEDLRTRIERIESSAVEEFNDHMSTVLELLEYENLERVWIERKEANARERGATESRFELHVVRTSDSGAVYEDTLDHLSESEREVTGLVFALAGYLTHDVYETVPFMLLDSLEAIDAERIAVLVDYFRDYANHLVVALLPEDARPLGEEYQRITM